MLLRRRPAGKVPIDKAWVRATDMNLPTYIEKDIFEKHEYDRDVAQHILAGVASGQSAVAVFTWYVLCCVVLCRVVVHGWSEKHDFALGIGD